MCDGFHHCPKCNDTSPCDEGQPILSCNDLVVCFCYCCLETRNDCIIEVPEKDDEKKRLGR